ncbi:site-specific DNA-methyltransferase [Iamia majanohamensis]|uniref:Methyltransferase n=1 Tax=Iamia majanohamensis TaxID=467976 RepID=A0AAF0BWW0_9ACTN|nr:site-specific DNA-methyltransferase [Iamia majanohamensis]WCO67899.1 site-specific DNA-methyltransferase [Iamia majanohamensis]
MTALVLRSDAGRLPLPDASVDLIVTSPPYFALRSYQDGGQHYDGQVGGEPHWRDFLEALWKVTAECWRVLKPTGSLWVNLGDKYSGAGGPGGDYNAGGLKDGQPRYGAADYWSKMAPANTGIRSKSLMGLPWRYALGCIDGHADPDGKGWVLRAEVVWSKPNGMPESVRDRVRRSHEQWFHFTREGSYYADLDPLRTDVVPGQSASARTFARATCPRPESPAGPAQHRADRDPVPAEHPKGAAPRSVWDVATEPLRVPDHLGVDHFAAFPTEFPRRIILGWSPPGGVVLDPFGGTGTTAMVARAHDRRGISADLSADYCRLARWRIFHSGGAAKARARTDAAAQMPLDLGAVS